MVTEHGHKTHNLAKKVAPVRKHIRYNNEGVFLDGKIRVDADTYPDEILETPTILQPASSFL